jgi:hypothetical protein
MRTIFCIYLIIYYINLEGFLKLDNFSDLDGIDLFSYLKVLQEILQKKKGDKYT